jgi:hypothetical protein
MPLELPNVTLCCIDTRFPELAEYSLHRSTTVAQVRFGEVLLFTAESRRRFEQRHATGVRVVGIDDIRSKNDYSRFVIRDLPDLVSGKHVLVTQWDSFVLDASAWREAFLEFDYIGAVWPFLPPPFRVGNGGFSLRSRRLLETARELVTEVRQNEDLLICMSHRRELEARYGVRFADEATAHAFAFERDAPAQRAFGFHGLFNFDLAFGRDELERWVEAMPAPLADTIEGAELAVRLFERGERATAQAIVRKRILSNPGDPMTQRLALKGWSRNEACWCGSGNAFKRCHGSVAA